MKRSASKRRSTEPPVVDEPGWQDRFQRGLQRALSTPPEHRTAPAPKPKTRPESKGRVHNKGKAGS